MLVFIFVTVTRIHLFSFIFNNNNNNNNNSLLQTRNGFVDKQNNKRGALHVEKNNRLYISKDCKYTNNSTVDPLLY